MTDKEMAKKKKEFIEYLQGERVYLGKAGQEIDAYEYILRTEEEVWQWISKLVEEVRFEGYLIRVNQEKNSKPMTEKDFNDALKDMIN